MRPRHRTASPSAIRAHQRSALASVGRSGLVAAIAFVIVGFLVLLLGPLAHWATVGADHLQGKEKADAINATRQILLAAAAGTAVLVGLGFTARTYYLSRRGQLTDRYTKATTQLASDKVTERLGGIYALEHLMRESEADHTTVLAVLAAFIRENASTNPPKTLDDQAPAPPLAEPSTPDIRQPEPRPAIDVQAALTVLARRPRRPEPDEIDLSNTDLCGSDLRWARLENAQLERTLLQYANLSSANLKGAFLRRAQLQHAWLVGTQLDDADLIDAQLEQANLGGAQLRQARLDMAQLRQAHLQGADLRSALLAGACLEDAYLAKAQLQNAHLAGSWIGGRVHMKSIGYHSKEKERDEVLDGAQLQGANLAGAQLQGAHLATCSRTGKLAPVRGLTVAQLAETDLDDTTELPDDLRTALDDHHKQQQRADGATQAPPPNPGH
jgi:uncharacterized protein YjbI with pentapeptide repeats